MHVYNNAFFLLSLPFSLIFFLLLSPISFCFHAFLLCHALVLIRTITVIMGSNASIEAWWVLWYNNWISAVPSKLIRGQIHQGGKEPISPPQSTTGCWHSRFCALPLKVATAASMSCLQWLCYSQNHFSISSSSYIHLYSFLRCCLRIRESNLNLLFRDEHLIVIFISILSHESLQSPLLCD